MDVPQTRYVTSADGALIAYQVFGAGAVDIVYVPGGLAHMEAMWEGDLGRPLLERLAKFARVVLLDRRGFGASERASELPTYEGQVDDILAVMDAAGCGDAVLFGGQIGGTLVALAAAAHPERCRALVLYVATPKVVTGPDWPWGTSADEWETLTRSIEEGDLAPLLSALGNPDDKVMAWEGRTFRTGSGPRGAAATMRAAAGVDIRPVLPGIRAPTLVLHTRGRERHFQVEVGRYLAEHIPDSRLVELPWTHTFDGDPLRIADEIEEFVTGVRPPPAVDRLLVTVLFTDIVGSTGQAAALGDARWREILDRHDEFTAKAVGAFRGRVVKTTGDGVLATFDGPARAIECARSLRDEARDLGIAIRAGLHTGEVELRGAGGGDVGGIAVHIASRIQSMAAPSEILVSRTVKDLVAGSGIEFDDRGEHQLKGVPDHWQVLAVRETPEAKEPATP